jgi:hypothetical protein
MPVFQHTMQLVKRYILIEYDIDIILLRTLLNINTLLIENKSVVKRLQIMQIKSLKLKILLINKHKLLT